VRVCFSTHLNLDPPDGSSQDPARPFSGSPDQIAQQFGRYLEVGVDSFMVGFGPRPPAEYERRMRLFAEQVRPAIAGRVSA
jgi:alkanesulfonate monooxygenase SsuD/methylene tetrahydromethanopterin reductase-like flavin-dependent oxidoreductase (luciferase family)